MNSSNIVHLIETHSEELCHRWLEEVRIHPDTATYHNYPETKLLGHIRNAYTHLGEMLRRDSRERVREIYTKLGADRFQQGFRLSEVIKAFILARRILWTFMDTRGFYNAMELQQAMLVRNQILQFFDRAQFFTAQGYEAERSVQAAVKERSHAHTR
jgi:hypothetical protein